MTVERLQLTPDYSIARVLNGCWQLSPDHTLHGSLDMDDVKEAFTMLVEEGFTTFDCADIYTGSEEFLGKFRQSLKHHSYLKPTDIQIHTKYVPDEDMLDHLTFDYTEKVIDRSLKRLQVDALDVVQFNWWDYNIPGYVETAHDLMKLQKKGKIRYISLTNFDTEHMKEIVDSGVPILTTQAQYSIFDRRPEKKMIKYCEDNNIALICYGTLAGGLLSNKYLGKKDIQPETRSQVKYMQVIDDTFGKEGYQELLRLLDKIAKKHDVEISHVANRYILDKEGVGAAAIGVRNSKHARSNMKIFEFDLDDEDKKAIDDEIAKYPNLPGEPFGLERTPGSKYKNIMKMNITEEEDSVDD